MVRVNLAPPLMHTQTLRLLVAALLATSSATAQSLLTQNFNSDTIGAAPAGWTLVNSSSGTLAVQDSATGASLDSSVPIGGQALRVNFSGATNRANLAFTPVTLVPGKTLAVEFDFNYNGAAPSTNDRSPQFAVFNGSTGYGVNINTNTGGASALQKYPSTVFTSAADTSVGTDLISSSDSGTHRHRLEIENVSGTITLRYYLDGTLKGSRTEDGTWGSPGTTQDYTTFSAFELRARGTGWIDNVSLTLLPDPTPAGSDQTIISQDFAASFTNFTVQSSSSNDGFAHSASSGVGNTAGRIDAVGTANHNDSVYYSGANSAVAWTTGQTYKTVIAFLQGTVADNNVYQVTNGFLRSAGSNFAGGGSGIWGQLRDNGAGNPFLRLYNQGTQVGSNSADFALTADTWYELETRMTLTSATLGDLSVYLYSRGADGTGVRTLIQSVTASAVTIGNNGFNAATFFSGFGGGNNSGSNIVAFDNFSVSSSSNTAPSAPTDLGANTGSNSSIVLRWTDASANETGFIVERSTSIDTGFTTIATPLAESTTYTDTGLSPGTTYYYRISASNTFGQSASSTVASASTATADTLYFDSFVSSFANFTVQNNGSSDGFSYTSSAGVAATSGRIDAIGAGNHTDSVYYSGTNSVTSWTSGINYKTSLFFLQGTVTDGQIYQVTNGFLRSTGSNFGGGGSGIWGQLRDSGAGDPFLRLFNQATQVGANSATFALSSNTWYELETCLTLSSATSGDIAVYLYSRGSDGTAARTLVQSLSATAITIGNNGFNTGSFVTTFGGGNFAGSNILAFDNFSLRAITAAPAIPAAPSSLVATAHSSTSIGLTWTDNATDETGFIIERSTTSGSGFTSIATPAADATSYTDTGLTPGTTYYYRISAANASGQSTASAESSATTRTAYAQWKLDTGLGADALDGADADSDGLANLVEYALGTSPTTTTASPIVTTVSGGFLTLTVTKTSPTPADVTLDAEATGDLVAGPWAPAVILLDDTSTFQARDTVTASSAARRFLRLTATR